MKLIIIIVISMLISGCSNTTGALVGGRVGGIDGAIVGSIVGDSMQKSTSKKDFARNLCFGGRKFSKNGEGRIDINNDGIKDKIFKTTKYKVFSGVTTKLLISYAKEDGSFEKIWHYAITYKADMHAAIIFKDVDRDGLLDLIWKVPGGFTCHYCICYNTGDKKRPFTYDEGYYQEFDA